MTTLELLRAAKEKIATPDTWTQNYYAIDAQGNCVPPTDPAACKWCATGAVTAVCKDLESDAYWGSRRFMFDATPPEADGSIVETNDKLGHAAVLAMFDRAIAEAERDEG